MAPGFEHRDKDDGAGGGSAFAAEVERLREKNVVGRSGRLRELFDFLAARGANAESASQAEIAETVFGHVDTDGDDATVRVYIHRLRKRLDDHYASHDAVARAGRLLVPSGVYALQFIADRDGAPKGEPTSAPEREREREAEPGRPRNFPRWLAIPMVLAVLAMAMAGWWLRGDPAPERANAIWQPLLASDRPVMLVLGDYYIYGEFDQRFSQIDRLVRDFSVNSAADLALLKESEPDRYARSEDMGLNYLPVSSAYGLSAVMPILARHAKPVSVMPASQLTSETLRDYNIVFIGLLSGMGMLESIGSAGSNFAVGETYDEIVDIDDGKSFHSEEALSLASNRYYKDYGYVSQFNEPGGAKVVVLAGLRDTGLRGLAALLAAPNLPDRLAAVAGKDKGFEAVVEITGQQGTDLSHRILRARPLGDRARD